MLTLILILIPLLSAIIVLLAGNKNAAKSALVLSCVQLVATIWVWSNFQNGGGTQFLLDRWWVESLGISLKVGMDGISLLLIILTNFLVPLIILSSFKTSYNNASAFYALILFMQFALVGVFASLDAFLFYVFWELALIPIYFICLIWGGENKAKITLKFFIYTLAGSLIMLLAIIYLYLQTPAPHSFDISVLYNIALSSTEQQFIFWAFFLAFAIKMPIFPLHTWQPDT
ncbi:MAG: NADH-quinone oxidoreductase subunit M, partial [Bacteroidia bacterium]|nr:NADH-quinone oxidoreductase subunit M [Bacteroidia bacterium]